MFRRRNKISLGSKILGLLWPAIGWRRSITYAAHRLARLPGTSYSVAAGFACGAAMSFTPFVGLHFVLSAIMAWFIRANIIASAIGTAVGNPWTFPFIWTWLYKTGTWMISGGGGDNVATPEFSAVFGHMLEALLRLDTQYMLETVAPVFWPMFVSGIPTAIVVWWVFFVPLKFMVQGYKDLRRRKRGTGFGAISKEKRR